MGKAFVGNYEFNEIEYSKLIFYGEKKIYKSQMFPNSTFFHLTVSNEIYELSQVFGEREEAVRYGRRFNNFDQFIKIRGTVEYLNYRNEKSELEAETNEKLFSKFGTILMELENLKCV
jgi:hypothetical protein